MAEEIGIARRVEQMDAGVLGAEGRDRELEGVLQLLFQGGVVARSGAALNAARRRDRPPAAGAPAAASSASARLVLPQPAWPTSAIVLMRLMEFATLCLLR